MGLLSSAIGAASKAVSSYAKNSGSSSSNKSSSSSPSSASSSGVTQTSNGGYAYTDKYGFSHVVDDYNTAQKYSGNGQVYNYSGNYGGGYALDNGGNRMAVNTPGAVAYGNDARDGITTQFTSTGLGSLISSPPKVNPVTNTVIKNNLSGLSSNASGLSSSGGNTAYASKTWGHDYKVDASGNVYKNGRLIPTEDYKHLPDDVNNYINSAKRASNVGATPTVPQQLTVPQQYYSIEDMINAEVQNKLKQESNAINQQLERAMQASQLNIKQNNSFLDEQLNKLRSEKTVADDKTINLQNRRGGFYSGGTDYQLAQNTQGYNSQQEALRREVEMRNAELYDRNRMLAEQAADQISQLQQQAPDLVRQRVREELDRQRQFAMQEAGLTGMYNGAPTMQLQNMQYGMEQDARQAQAQQQAQQVEQLWKVSDTLGFVHPQLAEILGIPADTPTMEARKMMLSAEQWQTGFNADQAYRADQSSRGWANINQDAYQFDTREANDNYWNQQKYDSDQAKADNKPISSSTMKAIQPMIDTIVNSGTYVKQDQFGYNRFNSEQSKEMLKDSIFKLNIPEEHQKALIQHFGLAPNFNQSSKGDGALSWTTMKQTSGLGDRKLFGKIENHKGVDLSMKTGTSIGANINGTVVYAGVGKKGTGYNNYGNVVAIKDNSGHVHVYGHLDSVGVKVGQKVSTGALLGKSGNTGKSTGPHLHYEVRRNGKLGDALSPYSYMG